MFTKIVRPCLTSQRFVVTRNFAQASEQPQIKKKWDLLAGVLVERLPVITKTLTPIEKKFQDFLHQVEFENSLKSDHELKFERDMIQAELIKKGEVEVDLDAAKQTAQDLEDAYTEEFKKFKTAPRVTEDDKLNNLKSTNRKLEDILYLFIEQKVNDKMCLVLPQGIRQDGETMRQTAERVLKETCGEDIKVFFYGNAPCGFHKFKYHPDKITESIGAKVFFFRTALERGNVDEKVAKKFEWLGKVDLEKKIQGSYGESIQKFLL